MSSLGPGLSSRSQFEYHSLLYKFFLSCLIPFTSLNVLFSALIGLINISNSSKFSYKLDSLFQSKNHLKFYSKFKIKKRISISAFNFLFHHLHCGRGSIETLEGLNTNFWNKSFLYFIHLPFDTFFYVFREIKEKWWKASIWWTLQH